jgi:hypothetical protein
MPQYNAATLDAIHAAANRAREALHRLMTPRPAAEPLKIPSLFSLPPCNAADGRRNTRRSSENFEAVSVSEQLIEKWSYRERLSRQDVPSSNAAFDFANAKRLGRELARHEQTPRTGLLHAIARKLGGWMNSGLRALDMAVRAAFDAVIPGPDALDVAMQKANEDWELFLARVGENERLAKLLALAYHLSKNRKGDWFAFPSVRIAKWLGCCRNWIGEGLKRLEELGLIVQQRKDGALSWSFKAGYAKVIRYAGPEISTEKWGNMAVEIIECENRVFEFEWTPDAPGRIKRQLKIRLLSGLELTEREWARVQEFVVRDLISRGNRVYRAGAVLEEDLP